jgi:UDP-3-O-[3-hydroxymyristoyl] glucosamine N-acyltransferase
MDEAVFESDSGKRTPAIRYRNPDGSTGGWVSPDAKIHPSAVIDARAVVGPYAHLPAGTMLGALTYVGMAQAGNGPPRIRRRKRG